MREPVPPPWWEATPAGKPIPLGLVKIDLAGNTAAAAELGPDQDDARKRRYYAGVEAAARAVGAAEPFQWQGDGVALYVTGADGPSVALRSAQLAKALWDLTTVQLGIPARIGVGASGQVAWNPQVGKLNHPSLNHAGHLEASTPDRSVGISADVYAALPDDLRRDFAALGFATKDGAPAFVFPRDAAARKEAGRFEREGDQQLWEAFRGYAEGTEIRKLRYAGLQLARAEPPTLDVEKVFVPPELERETRAPRFAEAMDRPRLEAEATAISPDDPRRAPFARDAWEEPSHRTVAFAETFAEERNLVILGDPGSGKTTLLRWLACTAAGGPLRLGADLGSEERLLPVIVSVGLLSEIRDSLAPNASVVDCLAAFFHSRSLGVRAELARFLDRCLEQGECLLLLDGLDEVGTADLANVRSWLESFVDHYPRNRVVATSRVVGFPGFAGGSPMTLTLRAFGDDQVRRFLDGFTRAYRRWEEGIDAATVAPDVDRSAAEDASQLLEALANSPRLEALARNPFMLTALALVHRAEGRLPRHRVQFYVLFGRALCETWGAARRLAPGTPDPGRVLPFEEEAIPILGELALRMFEEHPSGAAPTDFVESVLRQALVDRRGVAGADAQEAARGFLARARGEAQILIERGPDQWGFLHLTFLEFFVAAGLLAAERFEEVAIRHLYDPRWQEVLRLGVGYMALQQNRPVAAQRFIDKVLHEQPAGVDLALDAALGRRVAVAALLAAEAGDALPVAAQRTIATAFGGWAARAPDRIRDRYLRELATTEFRMVAAEPFLELLRDLESDVRASAARALGQLRAEAAIPALLQSLRDQASDVRWSAAEALGSLRAQAAVPALLELLKDQASEVRWEAARALSWGRLRAEAAIPALLESLKDQDSYVRGAAADALGQLRAEGAIPALLESLRDQDLDVRESAARALGDLRAEAAIPTLLESLKDQDSYVRGAAADALGQLRAEGAIPALLESLKDPSVHLAAARALWDLRSEAAIPAVLESLRDQDSAVRGAAARALWDLREEAAIPALLESLKDQDSHVRFAAAAAMGELRAEAAIPALLELLKDQASYVRWAAAAALGELRAEAALPALLELLKDQDSDVHWAAAAALGQLRSEAAIPALLESLKDQAWSVREAVLDALWQIAEAHPPGLAQRVEPAD